ncbi:MAG: sigma 54-interacting transcriptional regulator [Clostridiales bacterium]|nr:sigma 54-interacting transcriptional regulator [Clostridiales bacterium]MCI7618074.1 sigma 54-interacting transcriptional regulator [Bacillota bacterium]
MADGGTVLLDELNSMPVFLQSKLLRFLQDGLVRRLGGLTEEAVDVRVIAAVNEDPEELVERGILRADLFYRLNVIRINVPSLDEHKEDIPIYVEHFIEKANRRYGKEIKGVSDDVISELG